jgi:hypothetical protein
MIPGPRLRTIAPSSEWTAARVPPGWHGVVESFAAAVERSGLRVKAKIAERHGALRIDYGVAPRGDRNPKIEALVEAAEFAAACTCEQCGARTGIGTGRLCSACEATS